MSRHASFAALVLAIVIAAGSGWATLTRSATASDRRPATVSVRDQVPHSDSFVLGAADLPGLWTRDPISTVQPTIALVADCISRPSPGGPMRQAVTTSTFGESHTVIFSRTIVRNTASTVGTFGPTRLRSIRRCLARVARTTATAVSLSRLAMPSGMQGVFGFRVVGSLNSPTDHRRAVFDAIAFAHGNTETGVYAETVDPIRLTGLVNQAALTLARRLLTPPAPGQSS